MTIRYLLCLFLLLHGGRALAQQPAPPSAPAPPVAVALPESPDAPQDVLVSVSGGNFLGIFPEEITRENMNRYGLREVRGVGINRVSEDSPAGRAGLKKDDVILRFDGEAVTSIRKLNRLIGEAAPEQTVRLTISRGGVEQEVSVTLGKRSGFPRAYSLIVPPGVDQLAKLNEPRQLLEGLGGKQWNFNFAFGANRRIGMRTTQLTEQLADYFGIKGGRGLLVTSVSENSPAARAGLKAGDVITEVDGKRVETMGDLAREVNRKEQGDLTLTVIRDKSQRTIKVTPERGQTLPFHFSPEFEGMSLVGQIVLPRVKLKMPKIDLKATPVIRFSVTPL